MGNSVMCGKKENENNKFGILVNSKFLLELKGEKLKKKI